MVFLQKYYVLEKQAKNTYKISPYFNNYCRNSCLSLRWIWVCHRARITDIKNHRADSLFLDFSDNSKSLIKNDIMNDLFKLLLIASFEKYFDHEITEKII